MEIKNIIVEIRSSALSGMPAHRVPYGIDCEMTRGHLLLTRKRPVWYTVSTMSYIPFPEQESRLFWLDVKRSWLANPRLPIQWFPWFVRWPRLPTATSRNGRVGWAIVLLRAFHALKSRGTLLARSQPKFTECAHHSRRGYSIEHWIVLPVIIVCCEDNQTLMRLEHL